MPFEKNVFVNCPFDKEYLSYLRPLLFTLVSCGLEPKLSQTKDSGRVRIQHIYDLIKSSKYSIHDLSRMKAKKVGELARFNMPFELGLDMGARFSAPRNNRLSQKKFLIIDKEQFRYKAALSDLSGNDIEVYDNRPEMLVVKTRNWLLTHLRKRIDSGTVIWKNYNEFYFEFQESLEQEGYGSLDFEEMKFDEMIFYIKRWIKTRKI